MTRFWRIALLLAVTAVFAAGCGGGDGADSGGAGDRALEAGFPSPEGPLHFGTAFPNLPLTDTTGVEVRSHDLIRGRETVAIVLSAGCEVCKEMTETWRDLAAEIPDTVLVFAVLEEEPSFAVRYAQAQGFPFPVYCDIDGLFAARHDLEQYPTAIGVSREGTILYVRRGVTYMFTPRRAVDLLSRGKLELEKRKAAEAAGAEGEG